MRTQGDVNRLTQMLNYLDKKIEHKSWQLNNRPRELGYTWESIPDGQLRIDDGLGAEYLLPVELCETPGVIYSLPFNFYAMHP